MVSRLAHVTFILRRTQPVLDELHCEDGTLAARARIMDAINATAPVMEEIDDKVFIRRKLNKMEIAILKKAEFSSVKHIELELKRLIGTKLEREVNNSIRSWI